MGIFRFGFVLACCVAADVVSGAAPSQIERRLPPRGNALSAEVAAQLEARLVDLERRFAPMADRPHAADCGVLLKAVRLALQLEEFYKPEDAQKAMRLLEQAAVRLQALEHDGAPWNEQTGRVVRGYRSGVDGSLQPYALEIPADLVPNEPVPLYVWLHGRGDTTTDMHFIDQRMRQAGKIEIPGAIILHPFGRHCVGFKHAGEIDVLDGIREVQQHYPIDPERIVLIGFSMGGAGAWHVGAHFTDHFRAIAPGAGFAETAQYQRLQPSDYPPQWEQTLWRVYDVPNYVRNLFNVPVIAYSGELDKQIQAARVMEQAFASEGRELDHRIGPGMEHRYHPETLADLLNDLRAVTERDQDPYAPVYLQTRTLAYPRMQWIALDGLQQHYEDSRVDAGWEEGRWTLKTKNATHLAIDPPARHQGPRLIAVDGQRLQLPPRGECRLVRDKDGAWRLQSAGEEEMKRKRAGVQGPIDDAFRKPFLVVTPTGTFASKTVQSRLEFELQHFRDRWQALMRGAIREKPADQVTESDVRQFNLILWGDPSSNPWIARVAAAGGAEWPLRWNTAEIEIGDLRVDAGNHYPVLIQPNPLNPDRYVVLNSGLTFREGDDRSNSLQNPRLPDWALIALDQPPDEKQPGRVVDAGFFDERWRP